MTVKDFDVRFETGPVQRGAARLFRANVEVTERPGRSRLARRCWRSTSRSASAARRCT